MMKYLNTVVAVCALVLVFMSLFVSDPTEKFQLFVRGFLLAIFAAVSEEKD